MARFVDFDAAWAAQTEEVEPPVLRVLGEDVTLPIELPAAVMLLYTRARADDRERTRAAALDDVIAVLDPLIGVEMVQRCLDAGWGFTQLQALSAAAITAYRVDPADELDDEADDEGEDQPPATGATSPTSSKGGRSSRRTSSASTASTSPPTPSKRRGAPSAA